MAELLCKTMESPSESASGSTLRAVLWLTCYQMPVWRPNWTFRILKMTCKTSMAQVAPLSVWRCQFATCKPWCFGRLSTPWAPFRRSSACKEFQIKTPLLLPNIARNSSLSIAGWHNWSRESLMARFQDPSMNKVCGASAHCAANLQLSMSLS